jgi:hypothetical protein
MPIQKTTDLNVIRERPNRFCWGKVTKIHDIGRYTLVEYMDNDGNIEPVFHVYVDGADCSSGAESFDKGLILAIAIGNLGHGSSAHAMANAACKVLDLK